MRSRLPAVRPLPAQSPPPHWREHPIPTNPPRSLSPLKRVDPVNNLGWPATIAVAADRRYWERWGTAAKAGAWLKELRTLAAQITSELGTEIMFLDLGDLQCR